VPQVAVVVDWSAADDVEPRHVNQIMAQLGVPAPDGVPDGIYVALGSILPPVVSGSDDESRLKAVHDLQGSTIKVGVQGRFHMSRGVLEALINVLQATAAQYDAATRYSATGGANGDEG
jgi:hypothetical protein